jgi:O-antigen/teichoic acid export membrane protein
MSNNIRLGYSGIISFGSRVSSLFTGLIFITLVTRHLTQSDFGLWQLILSIISYSVYPNVIVDYWAVRDIARGEKHAKTAILFGLILSVGGMGLYLVISFLSAPKVGEQYIFFIIALAQVPLSYLSITLQTLSQAARPQTVGIAFMIFEIIKVVIAIMSFYTVGITLSVAILAVLGALVAQCAVLLIMLPRELYKRSFDKQIVKRWLKIAWLPCFVTVSGYIGTIDSLVVTMITGSTLALANYRAAYVIAALISHAGAFTFALYPKLIGGAGLGESRYVTKLMMLFSIPMSAGLFILSIPLLSVLGTSYKEAYIVLWLAIPVVINITINQLFDSILTGAEKVDVIKSSFRGYMKSRLFTVPEISLFAGLISIVTISISSYWLTLIHASYIIISITWAVIVLIISLPGIFIKWKMMQKSNITFEFPWKNIGIYGLASIVMSLGLLAGGAYNFKHLSTFDLVAKIMGYTALAVSIYTPIVFVLDKEFRVMTYKSIEILKELRNSGSR